MVATITWRVLVVLALYAAYLPLSGYSIGHFGFDAGEYWELSLKFTQQGGFSLLDYNDPVRGYLGPLLILPARLLCHYTGCSMLAGAQVLGAAWAALLFGVAIPALWAQVAGRGVSGPRWVVLVGLAFVFWRDYFNFTLTDMPALALLLLALLGLVRPGWGWAGLAGLALAAAVNVRPIYLASVPVCMWLLVRAPEGAPLGMGRRVGIRRLWPRSAAFVAAAALVLLPQFAINQTHFGEATPLVLARLPHMQTNSLYLEKLNWGLQHQKYETNAGTDYPANVLFFWDEAGIQLLREAGQGKFLSYPQYAQVLLRHPGTAVALLARRLFNGLDVQYPTPYVRVVYQSSWGLAWLNYTVWFGAALVLLRPRFRGWPPARWLVLAALLLPCLAVLPMSMECRFLLPLHLLLCAGLSFGWSGDWSWQFFRRRRPLHQLLWAGGYASFVGLCFAVSAAAQASLELGPRALF